jgi:hypothetical protein
MQSLVLVLHALPSAMVLIIRHLDSEQIANSYPGKDVVALEVVADAKIRLIVVNPVIVVLAIMLFALADRLTAIWVITPIVHRLFQQIILPL